MRPVPAVPLVHAPLIDAAGPVAPAGAADLSYVVHLQKRFGHAVGFIPRAGLAEKIGRGQVWLARENGEPAGYLHHGSLAVPEVRIFQAAVQYDARRRHLGLALVRHLADRAAAAGARGLSLRCLSYLDANAFWRAAGFTLLGTEPGAKGVLNVWGRPLREGGGDKGTMGHGDKATEEKEGSSAAVSLPPRLLVPSSPRVPVAFHSRVHPCPLCGRATTDTWARGAVRRRLCAGCVRAAGRG